MTHGTRPQTSAKRGPASLSHSRHQKNQAARSVPAGGPRLNLAALDVNPEKRPVHPLRAHKVELCRMVIEIDAIRRRE